MMKGLECSCDGKKTVSSAIVFIEVVQVVERHRVVSSGPQTFVRERYQELSIS